MVRPAVRRGRSEGEGQSTHVMQSRNGRQRDGSHAQKPRTFRLRLLRIEERLREVTKHMMDPTVQAAMMTPIGL